MTWRHWLAARRMLAEEFVGTYVRGAKDQEDAAFEKSLSNLPR